VEEINQIVVVGGEQSATLEIGQEVNHGGCDGRAIVGGGSPAQFVEQHKRMAGGMLENEGGFVQLHEEGTVPGKNIILSPQSREDSINQREAAASSRNVGTLKKELILAIRK